MVIEFWQILVVALAGALAIASALFALSTFVMMRRSRMAREKLQKVLQSMQVKDELIQDVVTKALDMERGDMRMALIRLMVEMEAGIREMAKKLDMESENTRLNTLMDAFEKRRIIPESVRVAFMSVWQTRNKAIHGLEVTNEELKTSLSQAAALLVVLKQI